MVHDRDVIGPRRRAWEHATAIPMAILAGVFIVTYSYLVLVPQARNEDALHGTERNVVGTILIVTWIAFLIDYVVRLMLSRHHRWLFVRYNLLDLMAVLVPVFRAFRLLRSLQEIDFFRRRSGAAVRTQVVIYAASFAALFVYMISLAVLAAERGAPGATILSFGDSIWWAFVTIATVGYGDMVPVTVPGRVYAVVLMIGGVAILGTASATMISYINERIGRPARAEQHTDRRDHEHHPEREPARDGDKRT